MTSVPATGVRAVRHQWAQHVWLAFFTRRFIRFVASVYVLISVSFLMIHLVPGDPVRASLGTTAPPALVEARTHQLGLDRPLLDQYVTYVGNVLHGDLGQSLVTNEPVSEIVSQRLPNTARLAGVTFIVIALLSLPLGLGMAILTYGGRRRRTETAFTGVTGLFLTVPEFVTATGLVALFAVGLNWFPVAGQTGLPSYVLPVASLAIGPIALLARIIRVEALKVLDEDYIRTARSKRLPARMIYLRHALPNMLTASLTIGGLILSGLVAGTILVETVFAWPGIGNTIVQSVLQKDYSLAQGMVLIFGSLVLIVNFGVDVLLALLDPRSTIRES